MRIQQLFEGIILALLTLVIYLFTINPLTREYSVYALVGCLLVASGVYVISLKKNDERHLLIHGKILKILIFTFVTAILLWVGNTGWVLSPFFYLLYIVGISLAFLFSTSVSFSFVLVLVAILLPNLSEVRSDFDIITVLSLLLIIPLSYFLSDTYLKVKEKEKKIIILEHERKTYKSKVEEMLENKITRIGAELREPINDIRQLALYYPQVETQKDKAEYRRRIVFSSQKAMDILEKFEKDTTGRRVKKNKTI